jgi:hypothetical protein
MYTLNILTESGATFQITENADLLCLGLQRKPEWSNEKVITFDLLKDDEYTFRWDRQNSMVLDTTTLDGVTPKPADYVG